MGNFYVNHTVRAPQDRVVDFLKEEGRTAFVSVATDGYTVVCDRECDQQNPLAITQLGQKLSSHLESPVLAVLNHDDDVLHYWLFEGGAVIEQYDSCPDYFDADEFDEDELRVFAEEAGAEEEDLADEGPEPTGDGRELCRAFGSPTVQEQVRSILASPGTFAVMQHEQLVSALRLPECAVGSGYSYVAKADAGLDPGQCVHVGQ